MNDPNEMLTPVEPPFGPSGRDVYERTYSRTKPDGSKESWADTVHRVVQGNLAFVYGDNAEDWSEKVWDEHERLVAYMLDFKIIPAGRHLWATGAKGRQYIMNCHTAGWGEKLSDHFEFTFLRLMEGGGVGANYSSRHLKPYGLPRRALRVHIVCDPGHPDYADMEAQGLLSGEYDSDWEGAYEIGDSREGWAAALTDLIDTYMTDDEVKHPNRVYDVSNVRAKGARLKTFGGTASGPAPLARMLREVESVMNAANLDGRREVTLGSDYILDKGAPQTLALTLDDGNGVIYHFPNAVVESEGGGRFHAQVFPTLREHLTPIEAMEIDHAIAECVVSGGNRRSARMSMVDWDDPYIHEFIHCKADTGKHWTTNISVAIDDDFLFDLDTLGEHLEAKGVHRAVVEGMLANGEPGYWNRSLSQEGEVGEVYATNPCGEIALQEWESCNLGHVNLDAFAPAKIGDAFDEDGLFDAHNLMTRFLIRATFADINDARQRGVQDRNRRIGVGHFGVQGFLAKSGVKYSEAFNGYANLASTLENLRSNVRWTARDYAFELRIPEPVKVTTVAPTGTIAKMPGVTEGIHPIYGRYFIRRIRYSMTDPDQATRVQQYIAEGFEVEECIYDSSGNTTVVSIPTKDLLVEQVEAMGYDPRLVEPADEISLEDMLKFQAGYQRYWADNAVSFTVNVPEGEYSNRDAELTVAAYLPSLKGTTIMPDGTREQAPYERITREEYEAYEARRVEDSTDGECFSGACPVR